MGKLYSEQIDAMKLPMMEYIRWEHCIHIKGYAYRVQYAHFMTEALNGDSKLRYLYLNTRSKKWMVVVVTKLGSEAYTNKHMTARGLASELSKEAIKYVTGGKVRTDGTELRDI